MENKELWPFHHRYCKGLLTDFCLPAMRVFLFFTIWRSYSIILIPLILFTNLNIILNISPSNTYKIHTLECCLGRKSHDLLSAVNKTDLYVEFVSERLPLPLKEPRALNRSQPVHLAPVCRVQANQSRPKLIHIYAIRASPK